MRILIFSFFIFALAGGNFSMPAFAGQETNFVITVKAKDANFIGTAAGGAQVVILNRLTGDIIASGITYGTTGDTATIMAENRARDTVLVTKDSAKWEFSLEFWEPTPVTITATAPLGQAQSTVSVSQDMIFFPGKDYTTGNGIMIEIPGFSVDIIDPPSNKKIKHDPDKPITVKASIMKLCGCHIEKNTPWAPERYDVEAHIYKEGLYITSVPMVYTGEPGIFQKNLKIPLPGAYRIHVTAFDSKTKESGMDTTTILLEE